ncbi:MAG: DUF885 domain-containing protein [Sphingomonas sp.]|nr:DUF885 domain-containing protein [Sphingomonas sp.]
MLIDRRFVLVGGTLALIAAAQPQDAAVSAELDEAAKLPPAERLARLRRIDRRELDTSIALDVAAALRGAELEVAIAGAADLQARYALQLRLQSGTEATPAEAYAFALDRARLITARAARLLRDEGLVDGSVAERLRRLARDPRYFYSDDDAGRDRAVADMNRWLDAARARLPQQFGMIPRAVDRVTVRRMSPADEAAGKAGYRVIPGYDGSTPGAYFVDLHDIGRRPSWTLPSVVHHETLPGHLLQLPLQDRAAPHPLRLRSAAGFVEGWAIYAEQLAAEAGAYAQDRRAEIGYLQWLLFRLGRAMMDVGINVFGWTDAAALAFLRDLQGDPVIFAPFEKDIARARTEPGAYAAHALNWLGFEQLVARRRSGDARRVHDRLLAYGAAPLVLLAPLLAH